MHVYIICMQKEAIVKFVKSHGGYARMGEFKESRFSTRDIARLVEDGELEKIKTGLYRLAEMSISSEEYMEMVDVCHAYPKAVVCLASALSFYDLTTFNPQKISIALPHNNRAPKMTHPPLRTYFFSDGFYGWGIATIKRKYGEIRVYEPEKTICDTFRYRKKLGEDMAMESLRNYLNNYKKPDIAKLIKYAQQSQTKTVMTPYLRALVE
jgi:predicted transcriptional regulator of viral defense system